MVPETQQRGHHNAPAWAALLRGLAILSLLLLPTSFRGGADATHAHAFLQTWADAADGHIDHHLHRLDGGAIATSWLEPRVEVRDGDNAGHARTNQVDTGTHEDSAPVTTSVHMLIAMISIADAPPRERGSLFTTMPPLMGFQPAVLSPPPQ
jgi:hypothetical protein